MKSQLLNDNVSRVARCPEICGRSLDTLFDRMGKHNFRQMGFRSDSGGLQTGIHTKTFFSGHKRNSYPKLSNHSIRKRNRESFKQKCNRKSSETGYYERPLKYSFSVSKEKWEDETCIKPSTYQQVSSEETFQNGLYEKSHTISRKRRLVHNSRLTCSRCILSPKNIQAPLQISSIQFQGQDVSVLSSKFLSYSGAKSFLKGHISSSSLFKTTEYSSCNISGRLVSPQSNHYGKIYSSF